MKIKVVLFSKDKDYKERIQQRILSSYYNKVQLSSFSDMAKAQERAEELRADIFLTDEDLNHDVLSLPKRCTLVLLTEETNVQSIGGVEAVAKYQAISELVSSLTDIYVRQAELQGVRFEAQESKEKKIVSFFPCAGGVGCSTLAAAVSLYLAEQGEKVLYLNLEDTGVADWYFSGNESKNFDKVLYTIQMDNSSTPMKLENALNQDGSGVYFYSGAGSALDMQDLDESLLEVLFEHLSKLDVFQWIIVDMDFSVRKRVFQQIERSSMTVFVSDGSQTANRKLKRISDALENVLQTETLRKLFLMYNRFSSVHSEKVQGTVFVEAGGIGRYENAKTKEIVQILSNSDSIRQIFNMNVEENI